MATRVAAQYALHDADELPLCRVTVRPRAAPLRRSGSGGANAGGSGNGGSPRLRTGQPHYGPTCPVAFASGADRDPLGMLGAAPGRARSGLGQAGRHQSGGRGGDGATAAAAAGQLADCSPGGSSDMDATALAALGHLAAAIAAAQQPPPAALAKARAPSRPRGRRATGHAVTARIAAEA
jgi:hypothetical protein